MPEAKLNVKLLKYTENPEITVATAAHLCYANSKIDELQKKMNSTYAEKLIKHLIESGHYSVLEHASFTFGVEGISRTLTHQLVRHRIASYSQQSQRYVNEKEFAYVIPPKIKADSEMNKKFEEFMETSRELYAKLSESVPKEDARFVLPNAAETRIIITMNTRSLYNFFEHRLCTRAQWEIRAMATEMLKEVTKVAPLLFSHIGPKCDSLGYCPEKKSCGRKPLKKDVIRE